MKNVIPSLKPDGRLVIIEHDPGKVPGAGSHSTAKDVLLNQAKQAGFELEKLMTFLQRIRALKRNTDLTKIMVIRNDGNEANYLTPFENGENYKPDFILETDDRIILPSQYVYVKGAVRIPGAYPFVFNLTAKEYAGMAGGDFRSGNIKKVR